MQGSGTFAVEAMILAVPKRGKPLLINGAYGQRARRIAEIAGRALPHDAEDTRQASQTRQDLAIRRSPTSSVHW
jgi:aspartate aminotransferase-like enzyme